MEFDQLLQLLERLLLIVALFFVYRSVPGHLIDRLITDARPHVEKTPNKIDDILLNVGEYLRGLQRDTGTDLEAPVDDEAESDTKKEA